MRVASSTTLAELRTARDRARAEYLAATRTIPRDNAERGRLWREFLEANAAYLRAKGETR
jgi:hypothetical protein